MIKWVNYLSQFNHCKQWNEMEEKKTSKQTKMKKKAENEIFFS